MHIAKNTFVYVFILDICRFQVYTDIVERRLFMTRQHNSKETKDLLINSAIENFLEKGYSNTRLEDIVSRVGLTRGAFYWNFSSKKELLEEIFVRYEKFYSDIYSSYEHFDSAKESLRSLFYLDLKKKNKLNPYVTIFRYKIEPSDEVSELKERQASMDETFSAFIENEIKRGQEQGEISANKNAHELALSAYMMLLGFDTYNSVHFSVSDEEIYPDSFIHGLVDMIMGFLD